MSKINSIKSKQSVSVTNEEVENSSAKFNLKLDEPDMDEIESPPSTRQRYFIRTFRREDKKNIVITTESQDRDFEKTFFVIDGLCETDKCALDVNLTRQEKLITALQESASILKCVTDSDISTAYIINPEAGTIIKIPENEQMQKICDGWKIGTGTTIAAFAAFKKQFIITDNIYEDMRFPEGLGYSDTPIQCVMAVPIVTPNDELKGVLEFTRKIGKENYSHGDLLRVITATAWIGNSVFYSDIYRVNMKQLAINQHLMRIIARHSSNFISFEAALSVIMAFGRSITKALKSAFFVVTAKGITEGMHADMYKEEDGDGTVTKSNILLSKENLAVLKAATSHKIVNNKDMDSELISGNMDKYTTLCLPIVRENKTFGIYQLINKKGGAYFSDEDELMIQNFTISFLLLLDLLTMKTKFERTTHELNVNNEIVLHHIKPCEHDEEELTKGLDIIPENLMTFLWYPAENDLNKLAELSLVLFHETLGENFMKMNNMSTFILTVKKCYRFVPYHNFEHAFTVMHTMANIICRNRELFSSIERESLMIATICHDLDHRGFTNNFIQMVNHPISQLYQGSPMENHHFFMTRKVMEQCDMCIYMNPEILKSLMKEIFDNIIFTDLSIYFLSRLQLVEALKRKEFSWDIDKFRYLIKGILMTACDLSAQTKPYFLSMRPTYNVYKEFFYQGDVERKMGLTPLPTMNRENVRFLPENQVQFLSVIIMPCYHLVATLIPNTAELFQGCKNLRSEWRELLDTDYISQGGISTDLEMARLLSESEEL